MLGGAYSKLWCYLKDLVGYIKVIWCYLKVLCYSFKKLMRK